MTLSFETRLADQYTNLSEALRLAADYLAANPVNAATRPLRKVSRESGVSPAAFTRLSKALSYSGYEELREEMRTKIDRRVNDFAARAERLQKHHKSDGIGFMDTHLSACQANLERFVTSVDRKKLDLAVDGLHRSRNVLLLGALGSTGIVEYLSYMANFCAQNWSMVSPTGGSLGGSLTGLDENDALIVVTKPPFADSAIRAAEMARNQGVFVIVITDTHACPALKHASAGFLVPTESPHFFSSYVATMFFVETLIGLLVGRSGEDARARIAKVESANRILAEVWDS